MKRFMYLILVGIITCTVGCQKNNTVMVPIEDSVVENNEDDPIDSSEDASEDNQQDTTSDILYDSETIRKILAEKYTCDTPPFYTEFDHEDEDGLYIYHIYESVTNDDESHIATIDWVTVDPKTGKATTLLGESFNIGDSASKVYEEGSPEYLFEQFLRGEIDAEILYSVENNQGETINISDLIFNPNEWCFEAFYEGEQLDLDNDGENELILDGPYGGMYLDAIDGKLYIFAKAYGNAGALDYTYYDGAYWIVYKDTTHGGRLFYSLKKYQGGDNLVDSMTLLGQWRSEDDKEFTFNEEKITEEEFYKLKDDIFASKTPVNQANYNLGEEEFFELISYLIFLKDYDGLPEDIMAYEIVYNLGEKFDNSSASSNDYRMNIASQKMLTSDLNIFFKDVLNSDKKYDAGYESISEAGIICKDDGYTYAYNGAGWGEYAVVKNVNKKQDVIEIEADIINGFDETTITTIKFTLKTADNTFGYTRG